MALYEESVESGQWLFKHRGFLPLFGVALLLTQIVSVRIPGQPSAVPLIWPLVCFGVSLVGVAFRAYTIGHAASGTSGRNRSTQVADSLNTTGAYSLVRHPLYLANYISWLGPVLVPLRIWPAIVIGLVFWLYYERIMLAEEAFLCAKYGKAFEDWAARTPAFLPNFRHWVPPATPFNIWVVLRREYSSLLQLVLIFAAINVVEWRVSFGVWRMDRFWIAALIVGVLAATALRLVRRHSTLLEDRTTEPWHPRNEMAGPTKSDRP